VIVAPTLDDLRSDPARVAALPAEAAAALLAQLSVEIAGYETLREALRLRTVAAATAHADDGEQLIGAEEFARILGRSKSWVEQHLDDLPPRRSLLGSPVWVKGDVERWIKALPKYGKY
jgi:hypothetical protein